jgi:hypothetical protein
MIFTHENLRPNGDLWERVRLAAEGQKKPKALFACPWCKAAARIVRVCDFDHVECTHCTAIGPPGETNCDAIHLWNNMVLALAKSVGYSKIPPNSNRCHKGHRKEVIE